jgi:hypothetical protein
MDEKITDIIEIENLNDSELPKPRFDKGYLKKLLQNSDS